MEITQDQLKNKLRQRFPIYLITGDVPLLCDEAYFALIASLKKNGFDMHERFDVNSSFDEVAFQHKTQNQNLFSTKTLIDMRFEKTRIDKSMVALWTSYLEANDPDTVLVIRLPKLTQTQKKSKWYQMLLNTGLIVAIRPIYQNAWPAWIKERMAQAKLTAEPDAYQLLADFTEGNLYAAHQTIQKLALLHPQGHLHYQQVAQATSLNSRYSVFDLTREALLGNFATVKRMLGQFIHDDSEITLVLWALTQEIRTLIQYHHEMHQGKSADSVLRGVWASRQPPLRKALQHTDTLLLRKLLKQAHHVDLCIKGLKAENPWLHVSHLALSLSGKTLCPY